MCKMSESSQTSGLDVKKRVAFSEGHDKEMVEDSSGGDEKQNVNNNKTHVVAEAGKERKKKRTSKLKRRWKPYYQLSWEERQELDTRESSRAQRVRAMRFKHGQPGNILCSIECKFTCWFCFIARIK